MTPSTHLLLDLIDLFERSAVLQAVREGSPLPSVPGSEVARMPSIGASEREAWLNQVGDAAAISVATDEGPVVVEIEDGDDGAFYRCPTTFRQRMLEVEQRHLVWMRARHYEWHVIGKRFGCDRTTAWRHWKRAMAQVIHCLDQREVHTLSADDKLRHA